jgi:hypothetical protein
MRATDDTNPLPFYHGTRADLKPGDLIAPGYCSNYGSRRTANFVYLSATLEAATWGAELALGDGRERIRRSGCVSPGALPAQVLSPSRAPRPRSLHSMFAVAAILLPKAREALRSSRSILDQGSPDFASIASLLRLERRAGTKGSAGSCPHPSASKAPGFAGEQMNL